jgi:hypothetical protein
VQQNNCSSVRRTTRIDIHIARPTRVISAAPKRSKTPAAIWSTPSFRISPRPTRAPPAKAVATNVHLDPRRASVFRNERQPAVLAFRRNQLGESRSRQTEARAPGAKKRQTKDLFRKIQFPSDASQEICLPCRHVT